MAYAVHFGATMLACYLAAQVLIRSDWTWHSPRVAILCWQAVGLAMGLCAIGLPLALGVAPYARPVAASLVALGRDLATRTLPAGIGGAQLLAVALGVVITGALCASTLRSLLLAVRAQRRHRDLLALVARADPAAPGALVLDHPSAAAYCLPGVRPQVVVSAGTLDLLDSAELAAVLSHERAHAQERHDLVILPFTALRHALPWIGWIRRANDRVALLVEMRADDKARDQHTDVQLARALRRFAAAGHVTPAGTLGAADQDIEMRVHRLLTRRRSSPVLGPAALTVAACLVAMPVSLFLA
ncbi:M56 family metallopeptidase [Melissospora conviva]|uniref:M56 family metallopeptidase n=1 Tax=Melissospora conviva TaxID=3388432 RepID=UPI003B76D408